MTEKDEIDDLRESVQALRERVSELERRLDSGDGKTSSGGPLDRYDRAVKENLDKSVAESHPRTIMKAYEHAGVVDKSKQKRRAKRLIRIEGE